MNGNALVFVGVCSESDAIRVNQGLVVDLEAKLRGQVPE